MSVQDRMPRPTVRNGRIWLETQDNNVVTRSKQLGSTPVQTSAISAKLRISEIASRVTGA